MASKATATTDGVAPAAALLDTFDALISGAEQVKAQTEVTPEVKAARQARTLVSTLAEVEGSDAFAEQVKAWMSTLAPEVAIDRTEGNALASAVGGLLAAHSAVEQAGFDPERAEALLIRWKAVSGRAPRGEGKGDGAQDVPCPIHVVFTYPEGSEVDLAADITHASTWSSVSAEITKRAQILEGVSRNQGYTRPPVARDAWRAAMAAIKDGESGPFSVEVPTKSGIMLAEVSAIR